METKKQFLRIVGVALMLSIMIPAYGLSFPELIRKCRTGKCSPAEKRQLEEWRKKAAQSIRKSQKQPIEFEIEELPPNHLVLPGGDRAVVTSLSDLKQLASMFKRDIQDHINRVTKTMKPATAEELLSQYKQLLKQISLFLGIVQRAKENELQSLINRLQSILSIYGNLVTYENELRLE